MKSRWGAILAALLVAFASLSMAWQLRHSKLGLSDPYPEPYSSLVRTYQRGNDLAGVSNIVDRSGEYYLASGVCRNIDLLLPENVSVFLTDMTGISNRNKLPIYYYLTYHLFPREIGTSLDHATHLTMAGFSGETSDSDEEIRAHGFDVRFDYLPGMQLQKKVLRDLPMRVPQRPSWFGSWHDAIISFLLPLLTALAGMWLLRLLFPGLNGQMPVGEQLACSMGLGMMALAALTLGVKLAGFHGRWLGFAIVAAGAMAELWHDRKSLLAGMAGGGAKLFRCPAAAIFGCAGLLVFAILFRIAGLEGMVDPDAAMAWLLKAKIIHLYAGSDLVRWFSDPHLALANLDYPTLMPSLHAASYDSLGHVDEFVTKFWPVWMLFFLFAALGSLTRDRTNWHPVLFFTLLGLLLLPAIQRYGQMEGGVVPMIFFTVLGLRLYAGWLVDKSRARLALGLVLLLGAAMTKFEGFIFLALAGGWMLLVPAARPPGKPWPHLWRLVLFCVLAALPFICLRVRIPAGYQSGWLGSVLHDPGGMLASWPVFFLIQFAPLFVSRDLTSWNGADGSLHWTGKWHGIASLYSEPTLGLGWVCLLITLVLWFALPARRPVLVWGMAMLLGSLAALSVIFASFVSRGSLGETINLYVDDITAGRYLLPVLLAWFAVLLTLIFADQSPPASALATNTTLASAPPAGGDFHPHLPELKMTRWLIAGAVLIMVFGGLVLPKIKPLPPQNPGSWATSPQENADMQLMTGDAIQLERAGKFAEAIEKFGTAARLYPNNPTALNNYAWSLLANPGKELHNGPLALRLSSKAIELTGGQQPDFIRTLAAAYAEVGQTGKAAEMARKARAVALANHQPEVAARNDQLLKAWLPSLAGDSTNSP